LRPAGTVTLLAWIGSQVSGMSLMMFEDGPTVPPADQPMSVNQVTDAWPLRLTACPDAKRYLPP
jgi:hypothetical protein